jgi:hypothetical protein
VIEDGRPILLVEAKRSDRPVDRSLRYLKKRFPQAEAWQVALDGRQGVDPHYPSCESRASSGQSATEE